MRKAILLISICMLSSLTYGQKTIKKDGLKWYVDEDYRGVEDSHNVKYKKKIKKNVPSGGNGRRGKYGERYYRDDVYYTPYGEAEYYYQNGNIRSKVFWKKGKEHGEYNSYFNNGKTRAIGNFNSGKPIGKWIRYYKNGKINSESEYSADSKYVYNTEYYEDGQLKEKGKSTSKDDDDKIGIWEYYYENGNLKEKGEYIGQIGYEKGVIDKYIKVGEWKSYYSNGKLESFENYEKIKKGWYVTAAKSGVFKYYNQDGSPHVYITHSYTLKDGLDTNIEKEEYFHKNGKTRIIITDGRDNMQAFDEDGNKASILFFDRDWKITKEPYDAEYYRIYNPNKNGTNRIVRHYYLDTHSIQWEGCLITVNEQDSSNDKKCEGENKYYHNIDRYHKYIENRVVNTKIEVTGFINKNGNRDGSWKMYYKDSQIHMESVFKNGKREGKYISYYQNGNTKQIGYYKDGEREGIWKLYRENSVLEYEIEFKNNKRIETKEFDKNGILKN